MCYVNILPIAHNAFLPYAHTNVLNTSIKTLYVINLGLSRCLGPGECLHSFIHVINMAGHIVMVYLPVSNFAKTENNNILHVLQYGGLDRRREVV